jgi:Flp pilus assembly protein TadB
VSRLLIVVAVACWAGMTLLLAELRWFRRPPLAERLRRFGPAPAPGDARPGVLSVASFREVVAPLAQTVGSALARALGVHDDLAARLARAHSALDVAGFRLRQAAWAMTAFGLALVAALATGAPTLVGLFFVLGAPVLAFLVGEQQAINASKRWQQRLFAELPVVAEQLAMLLGAGYSLGAALGRLASRGDGACARDLSRVVNRIRQGLSESDALEEWAELAAVDELRRLVGVLALNRQGGDLGRLVADEARSMRREAHRRDIELIERRAQMVWVPVTVATLVPGVMFMAVPFIAALRDFASL